MLAFLLQVAYVVLDDFAISRVRERMRFGEKIRELRKKKSLSQESLAKLVGITAPYLSKVENHRLDFGEHPAEKLIHKLASVLDADETELLLLAEKVPPNIRQRLFERPEIFSQIAELDDEELDLLILHILDRPKQV
tara:strand:- start:1632 stop:2042 length:411 start_codon:yes stop_codon:yes gene_type:complete